MCARVWSVFVVALSTVFVAQVWAGEPTDQLKGSVEKVLQILQDLNLPPAERRAAIRKEANHIFDFPETARRALGQHWQNL